MILFCDAEYIPLVIEDAKFRQLPPDKIAELPLGKVIYFFNPAAVDLSELAGIELKEGTIIPVRVRKGMRVQDEVCAYLIED